MEYFDDKNETYAACDDLRHVANNLFAVGLDIPAEAIKHCAGRIRECMDRIDKQQWEDSQRQFQAAQQSSVNVLNAVLGGIEIGKRENQS